MFEFELFLNQLETFVTTSDHIESTQTQFPAILAGSIPTHIQSGLVGLRRQNMGINVECVFGLALFELFLNLNHLNYF